MGLPAGAQEQVPQAGRRGAGPALAGPWKGQGLVVEVPRCLADPLGESAGTGPCEVVWGQTDRTGTLDASRQGGMLLAPGKGSDRGMLAGCQASQVSAQ